MYTSDIKYYTNFTAHSTRYKVSQIQIQYQLISSIELYWFQRSKSLDKHTPITGKSSPIGAVVWKGRGKIVVHATRTNVPAVIRCPQNCFRSVRYARYLHKRTILQKIAFHGKGENKVRKRTTVKIYAHSAKSTRMQFVEISTARFSDALQFALIRIALNDISTENNFDCTRGKADNVSLNTGKNRFHPACCLARRDNRSYFLIKLEQKN